MSEAPKLYANKPKKAQLKQFQEQPKAMNSAKPASSTTPSSASAAAAAASYMTGSQSSAPPPPPPPPKQSFARRYRFLWPLLLTVNLAVGAYLFMRTKKKDGTSTDEEEVSAVASTPVTMAPGTTVENTKRLPSPPIAEVVKVREPIPVDKQRELFKWILEEKRKVNPRDPEEKKRINEEKAILKQFIRAKSIPNL